MTTIIAVETAHGVSIGYDSMCSSGGEKFELEHPKVFTNNGAIYGVAGRLLLSTELCYADLPAPPKKKHKTDRWVTRELSPHIRDIIDSVMPKRDDDGVECQFLVIANGRAYEISGDSGWHRRTDGIYAIGSGCDLARGALMAGANINKALEIAADHDAGTGYDFTTCSAADMLDE